MQPKNKNVRNELPPRYRKYCEFKRHLGERSSREVLPIGETNESVIKISKRGKHQQDIVYRTDGIMTSLSAGTHGSAKHLTKIEQINNPKHSNDRVYEANGISPTLNTMQGGRRQPLIKNPLKGKTKYGWHFEQNVFDDTGISRAVKSSDGSGNRLKIIKPVLTPDRPNKRQDGRRMKNDGEPMFTLTEQDRHGVAIIDKKGKPKNKNYASTLSGGGHSGGNHSDMDLLAMRWQRTEKGKQVRKENRKKGRDYTPFSSGHRELVPVEGKPVGALTTQAIAKDSLLGNDTQIRRLTPTECMRLQGFPDSWCDIGADGKEISDTQKYKMAGNAVTTNVIKAIIERLLL